MRMGMKDDKGAGLIRRNRQSVEKRTRRKMREEKYPQDDVETRTITMRIGGGALLNQSHQEDADTKKRRKIREEKHPQNQYHLHQENAERKTLTQMTGTANPHSRALPENRKRTTETTKAPIPKPLTPKPKKSPAKRQSFLSNFGIRKNVEDVSDDSDHAPVSPSTKRTSSMAKNKKWSISRPPKPQQPDLESSINELNAASLAARLYERRRSLHPQTTSSTSPLEDLREIRDLELEAATAAWMVAREKKKDPFVFHEKRDPMRPFRRLWYMLMTKGAHDGEHLRRSPTEGVPPEVLQNETVESDQTLFGAVKGLETRKEFEERWRDCEEGVEKDEDGGNVHEVYVELGYDEEYDRDEQGKIRNVLDQTGPEGENPSPRCNVISKGRDCEISDG
ncbi:hypothetical protein BC829DRAFT_63869 [Chytridium lagenaria]|nr:hypothetical protein BC829DRAFT_63869 [Chytridium lagenaria]